MSQKLSQRKRHPADQPMRLGFGASAPERNIFARWCFFQAVVRRVPPCIRELVAISQQNLKRFDAERFDSDSERALSAWATKWGIPYPDPWWIAPIRSTVDHWHSFPDEAGHWPGVIGSYADRAYPTLEWRSREESERDFDEKVRQYKAKVKKSSSFTPTPETFTERHFEAFVLEHVARERLERIPELLGILDGDASSIRKRNSQLADLLGLQLRRHQPGRPTKTKKTGTLTR